MSDNTSNVQESIHTCQGSDMDARYLGYFPCFNRGFYYEAHEVLEKLWLADRRGPNAAFYKGLIQLAGAFVHVQRSRPVPAASLFRRAHEHLKPYAPIHQRLPVTEVLELIDSWLARVQKSGRSMEKLTASERPSIRLLDGA